MDHQEATERLAAERRRVEQLIDEEREAGQEDRGSALETGDIADSAEPLTDEEVADALGVGLRQRLAAIERAEARLRDGSYGRSIRSGLPIPDERLEADPAAELTVEESLEG